jgi:CspA family cold shock protein
MSESKVISTQQLGKIKWFNNKSGYGFITATSGDYSEKDIFVHYSTIRVANKQYKFLVQGEYVQFDLIKSTSDKHEYQADNVTGVNGGELMCETRRNIKLDNEKKKKPKSDENNGVEATENKDDTDGEFKKVERKRKPRTKKPTVKSAEK